MLSLSSFKAARLGPGFAWALLLAASGASAQSAAAQSAAAQSAAAQSAAAQSNTAQTGGPAASVTQGSELENSAAVEALSHHGLELEPSPEGKLVERVEVYVLDVFDDRDPIPNFVNVLHTSSRSWVVKQEVLLSVGSPWESGRVLETERNLRKLRQISLANVVSAKGSTPDKVVVVVVVKDVWSLRLNSDFAVGSSGLDYLVLNPAEENFAGTHINAGLLYYLERNRQSFGGRFIYPRLAGSRFWVATELTISTNRDTGAAEGTSGAFIYRLPQYSRHNKWAFGTEFAWRLEVTRRYDGTEIRQFQNELPSGAVESVPETYHTDRVAAEYWGLRSFGVQWKKDLSFGLEVDHRRYRSFDLSSYTQETAEAFDAQVLPVSDRRVSPYVQLRSYQTKFHRVLNMEILGLQEDYRVGHDSLARLYVAAQGAGSSRDLVGGIFGVGYTLPLGDGLLAAVASNELVVADEAKNEGVVLGHARWASPTALFGRLHLDAFAVHRYLNYLNTAPFALGGNNRLRGYRFDERQGTDVLALNAEFRTDSVDILSAQVGLAAFFDAGDAASAFGLMSLRTSAGMGLRVLFPQAERSVLRLDWGLPFYGDRDVFPGALFLTFGQAFSMPRLTTRSVISSLSLFKQQ